MKIVQPQFEIIDHSDLTKTIERAGRTCYKSEDKICEGSDEIFINKLKNVFKHESVLEHGSISVHVSTDRAVSLEAVRHRIASYSQESTRYCAYAKDKFGNEINVIQPFFFDPFEEQQNVFIPNIVCKDDGICLDKENTSNVLRLNSLDVWMLTCLWTEWGYMTLVNQFKRSAQEARSVLPNSLKTEIVITANPREWIHILRMRTASNAHPQIRQIMVPLGKEFAKRWPAIFEEFADTEHPAPAIMIENTNEE